MRKPPSARARRDSPAIGHRRPSAYPHRQTARWVAGWRDWRPGRWQPNLPTNLHAPRAAQRRCRSDPPPGRSSRPHSHPGTTPTHSRSCRRGRVDWGSAVSLPRSGHANCHCTSRSCRVRHPPAMRSHRVRYCRPGRHTPTRSRSVGEQADGLDGPWPAWRRMPGSRPRKSAGRAVGHRDPGSDWHP